MTIPYAEKSEQDWFAAYDTILMLGNVDMFYVPDLVWPADLYQYVATKVRRRIHHIMSRLDGDADVAPILETMLEHCTNFQATLHNARYLDSQGDEVELSEQEATALAQRFLDEMSVPITQLVETYDLHPDNQYLTELMVRPA